MEDGKYKTRCLEINSATIEEKRVRLEELFSAVIRHIEEYLNDCNIDIFLSEHKDKYEWWAQLEIRPTKCAEDVCQRCGTNFVDDAEFCYKCGTRR